MMQSKNMAIFKSAISVADSFAFAQISNIARISIIGRISIFGRISIII